MFSLYRFLQLPCIKRSYEYLILMSSTKNFTTHIRQPIEERYIPKYRRILYNLHYYENAQRIARKST